MRIDLDRIAEDRFGLHRRVDETDHEVRRRVSMIFTKPEDTQLQELGKESAIAAWQEHHAACRTCGCGLIGRCDVGVKALLEASRWSRYHPGWASARDVVDVRTWNPTLIPPSWCAYPDGTPP